MYESLIDINLKNIDILNVGDTIVSNDIIKYTVTVMQVAEIEKFKDCYYVMCIMPKDIENYRSMSNSFRQVKFMRCFIRMDNNLKIDLKKLI